MKSANEIKQAEARIKENVRHANDIAKIGVCLSSKDKVLCHAAIQSLRRIFSYYLDKGDLQVGTKSQLDNSKEVINTFRVWLKENYTTFIDECLKLLHDSDPNTQNCSLRSLMELLSITSSEKNLNAFDSELLSKILNQVINMSDISKEFRSTFEGEYVQAYIDIQFYLQKCLEKIIEQILSDEASSRKIINDNMCRNLFLILKMTLSNPPAKDEHSDSTKRNNYFVSICNSQTLSLKRRRQIFSKCWIAYFKLPLPQDICFDILVELPLKIIPFMNNPLALADFLTETYNLGGIAGLHALNSLYILIQKHNFDYPNFYQKLYDLLEEEKIFFSEHRLEMFKLVDTFLSSSHLPAYLAAAFSKRFAQVALYAPPGPAINMLHIVKNLLARNKECSQLIHRPISSSISDQANRKRSLLKCKDEIEKSSKLHKFQDISEFNSNIFQHKNKDILNSDALHSSLWEVKTMQNHYNANVAMFSKTFEEKLKSTPTALESHSDSSYTELFEKQIKRREKQVTPLAFGECKSLFQLNDTFDHIFAMN